MGFFIDFDVTHILRDLPIEKLRHIANGAKNGTDEAITYVNDPISGIVYGIRHMPHKFLTIIRVGDPILDTDGRPERTERDVIRRVKGSGRRITIYDIFGYFQSSFLAALERWSIGTEHERQQIADGKKERQDFTLPLPDHVVAYNVLECRLIAQLMQSVDATAEKLGLPLRKYYGAGTLAELLFDKYRVGEYREDADQRPAALRDAIQCGFYGGRFEAAVVGVVPEMHNVDIASAYPAAMPSLPCLRHGDWVHLSSMSEVQLQRRAPSTLLRVRWDVSWTGDLPFAPFPYRCGDGSLFYPPAGHGWYWKDEVEAAVNCFGGDCFEVAEAWEFRPRCSHRPFAWVRDVYEQRVKLGKNDAGLVLKLGLNSVYGKLAQSVGRAQYADFAWAGMITARTRARLLQLLARAGDHVVMLATDGAYIDCRPSDLGLETSAAPPLGGWEYRPGDHVHRGALLVQSGFWLDGEEPAAGATIGGRVGRTRGVNRAALSATNGRARFYEAFRGQGIGARVTIGPADVEPGTRLPMAFIGIRGALHLNKPEWLATWQPIEKTITFDPRPKRTPLLQRDGESFIRTVPAAMSGNVAQFGVNGMLELSAPYSRIRVKDNEKDLYFEQPEQMQTLVQLLIDNE